MISADDERQNEVLRNTIHALGAALDAARAERDAWRAYAEACEQLVAVKRLPLVVGLRPMAKEVGSGARSAELTTH